MCWLQVHVIFSNELHNFVYSDFDCIYMSVIFLSIWPTGTYQCRILGLANLCNEHISST